MMPAGNTVKKTAKAAMKGNYSNLAIAAFIAVYAVISGALCAGVLFGVLDIIAVFADIAFLMFVITPLIFGVFKYYRRAMWGVKESPTEVLSVFRSGKDYIRALSLGLFLFARIFVCLIIFTIPASVASALSESTFYSNMGIAMPTFAPALSVVSKLFFAVGIFLTFLVNLKFYLMPFLMASNDNIGVVEASRLSRTISRESAADFCWLICSMAGWIICSLLIVPLIFTLPYMLSCYTVHCGFCVAEYNKTAVAVRDGTPSFNPKF